MVLYTTLDYQYRITIKRRPSRVAYYYYKIVNNINISQLNTAIVADRDARACSVQVFLEHIILYFIRFFFLFRILLTVLLYYRVSRCYRGTRRVDDGELPSTDTRARAHMVVCSRVGSNSPQNRPTTVASPAFFFFFS